MFLGSVPSWKVSPGRHSYNPCAICRRLKRPFNMAYSVLKGMVLSKKQETLLSKFIWHPHHYTEQIKTYYFDKPKS
jgi:hypothetical protein